MTAPVTKSTFSYLSFLPAANPLLPRNLCLLTLPKVSPDTHFVSQNAIRSVAQPLKPHNIPINIKKKNLHHYYIIFGIYYIITTSKPGDSTSFLYHRKIPLQKAYTVSTSLFLISTSFLHQNQRNLHHFYIIPAYNVPIDVDTLFDTLCESPKTISFLHRSYIIPISFFRFLYHFYIAENFCSCRHYIVTISFF